MCVSILRYFRIRFNLFSHDPQECVKIAIGEGWILYELRDKSLYKNLPVLLKIYLAKKAETCVEASSGKINSSLLKS